MGLKGYRLWVMGQLDSTCRAPPWSAWIQPLSPQRRKVEKMVTKFAASNATLALLRRGMGDLRALRKGAVKRIQMIINRGDAAKETAGASAVGKYCLINRSTYLSGETVLPIKRNRSTYRVKPFYLSSETVLPIKRKRSTFQMRLVPLHQAKRAADARAKNAAVMRLLRKQNAMKR